MSIYTDTAELKKLFEENIFRPAGPKDIQVRKDDILTRKLSAMRRFAGDWKVTSLSVNHPFSDTDIDNNDTGMFAWWRNNRKWKERGIYKVDVDWQKITFYFDEPKTHSDAIKLVSEFINDWANKPDSQNKVITIGDMVYLIGSDVTDERWYTAADSGKVTGILGDTIKIRFHHHGNVDLKQSDMTFDKESNSWNVTRNAKFTSTMTQKKGTPKVGSQCRIIVPAEDRIAVDRHGRLTSSDNQVYGLIQSITNGVATVRYRPPREDYAAPQPAEKTIEINISDFDYSWVSKHWYQKGVSR